MPMTAKQNTAARMKTSIAILVRDIEEWKSLRSDEWVKDRLGFWKRREKCQSIEKVQRSRVLILIVKPDPRLTS